MKLPAQNVALKLTAIYGALAVALGAFGAHGLKDLLVEHGRVATWDTATFYLLVHVVVMLVLSIFRDWKPIPWLLFLSGVTIFSGSLYLLCLTNTGWLGAITPIGGVCLIAGWLGVAFHKGTTS